MVELLPLDHPHEASVLAYLSRAPIENVMMLGLIHEDGLPGDGYREFLGIREDGEWIGIACFSGDIALYCTDERAIDLFAEFALRRFPIVPRVISKEETVNRFWERFRDAPYPVLFDRRQFVYLLDPQDLTHPGDASVRLARPDEAEQVARLASAMSAEEIQLDPLRDHRASYMRLIRRRIALKRYYVLEEGGVIKFQAHLNSLTPDVGQITGVYTPPAYRQQGYATRGLGGFCRLALERVPKLCLFVNDFNTPAIRLYEKLGFRRDMPYRAIFLNAGY